MFTIDTNTLNGTIVISDIFNIGASASDADATPYINSIGTIKSAPLLLYMLHRNKI